MQLKEWFGGPIIHIHTHIDDLSFESQPGENRQFTLESAYAYAKKFTGNQEVILVDTDHSALIMHPDWACDSNQEYFYPQNLPITRDLISKSVLERSIKVKKIGNPNIITGTETNILDKNGQLDIHSEALNSLDLVIASIHYYPWAAYNFANGQKGHIAIEDIVSSYINASKNPNVDILGHPTAYIQKYNRNPDDVSAWNELFETMKAYNTAFEINMSRIDEKLKLGEGDFDFKIIESAAHFGVKLVLGLDFHNVHSYLGKTSQGSVSTDKAIDEMFEKMKGNANSAFLHSLRIITQKLKKIGVTKDMIINNSNQSFTEWHQSRTDKTKNN